MEDNNEGNGAIDSTQRKLAELITYPTSEWRTQASVAERVHIASLSFTFLLHNKHWLQWPPKLKADYL
jgi:hypothetical protein